MVLQVNLLIYAYMALCVCMLFFNIIFVSRVRWQRLRHPGRERKYREWMECCLDHPSSEQLGEFKKKVWTRKMRRCSELILFQNALEQMSEDENVHEKIVQWMYTNRELILQISDAYLKKKGMEKAFYAYLVEAYRLCSPSDHDPFVMQMHQLVMDHSIYCRENALCALYASGHPGHVVKAFEILTRMEIVHSLKMVTDGLLTFRGDKEELALALWEDWDHFFDAYKVAFINFMRMVSGNFTEAFLPMLTNGDTDREIRFAVIRYYRKYYCPAAENTLQSFVEQWEQVDWEYAALAALSLEKYPGQRTVTALREGCRSRNWHVRYNSARSLSRLVYLPVLRVMADAESDAYAKDMLVYIISQTEVIPDDGRH